MRNCNGFKIRLSFKSREGQQFSKKERTAGRSELELPEVDEPGVLVSSPVASVFVSRVEVGKVDNKSLES